MLTKLVMKCFKKHEDKTIDFAEGLTAMLGANEKGKSTTYHAITYALGGARALPEPLEEFVTYGQPISQLKVSLVFLHEGAEIRIDRSKAGARLTHGATTVTGQSEVTKYVERLLGVSVDMLTKLLIASQNKLRGALESGDAVAMIEKLANINLIDELVEKIQETLPCGNTKAIVSALADISELEQPVLNVGELETTVAEAKERVGTASAKVVSVEGKLYSADYVAAVKLLEKHGNAVAVRRNIEQDIEVLQQKLSEVKVWPASELIESLQAKEAAQAAYSVELSMYKQYCSLPKSSETYTATEKDRLFRAPEVLKEIEVKLAEIDKAKALLSYQLVTDMVCKSCNRPRDDYAAVAEANRVINEKLQLLNVQLGELLNAKKDCTRLMKELDRYKKYEATVDALKTKLGDRVSVCSTYPKTLGWNLVSTDEEEDLTDYKTLTAEARKLETAKAVYLAAKVEQQKQLDEKLAKLETLGVCTQGEKQQAEAVVAERDKLANTLPGLRSQQTEWSRWLARAEQALAVAQQTYKVNLEAWDRAQATKAALTEQLQAMQSNNALIKKLRDVRPIVATRLWSVVLSAVSTYFSQIRGEVSVVTRSESGFKVNGRPATGLSGSTLDSLGLAIRMALSKTFLPSIDFMLLDEPAAGMDEARETAMLGLLAAVNYRQVVVVTHSNLADSFAAQVIQL